MKKSLIIFIFFSLNIFSQKTDSLTWYKARAKAYELKLQNDSSFKMAKQGIQYEYDKKEAELKLELEEQERFYKMRIDKLQTLLIASCVSSVLVIGFAFYMIRKKKAGELKK